MSTRKINLLQIHQNTVAKFLKRCWMIFAFLVIATAILSSVFRAITPWAKQYKGKVEHYLSAMLGEAVTIHTMETSWYWFEPIIKLNQVKISDGKQDPLRLSHLFVGINLFSSLLHGRVQSGVLFIEDLHLSLHQTNQSWKIDGLDSKDRPKINWKLAWLLAQQKIVIKNLSANLHMRDGTLIPLTELNLDIVNRAGHYTIKGRGSLAQSVATNFQLYADLNVDPYALNETSGQVFFSIQHLLPEQWQDFVGQSRFQFLKGKGDLQLWSNIAKGQIQNTQARVRIHNLAWMDQKTQKTQEIQDLKANLAWKPTHEGWELSGNHIKLQLDNILWPENSLLLRYQKDQKSYFVYVKNILLESLLSTSLNWPQALDSILPLKPHGQFHDTQIQVKNAKLVSLLTRFSDLGWKALATSPGVDNLAGVMDWQPEQGALELVGEKTVITQRNQAPLTLSLLSASFTWQRFGDGLRINMERFIVNHPHLLLNLKGMMDKITDSFAGQLTLTGNFEAKNGQHLLTYLPDHYLKPRLKAWLKHDVKRMNKVQGKINVQGPLADFPFDKQPGVFSISSHLTGVDLIFAQNWPVAKNIEAYLNVNKRTLEANIVNVQLNDVNLNQASLVVNNLGLNKEVLLIHTKVKTPSESALSYVMTSPLRHKISTLGLLKLQGLLDLDFKLEAALYPGNDDIFVLGNIDFHDNLANVHHSMGNVELKNLTGNLQFNEKGVLESNLQARVLESPVNLIIHSVSQPIPYTEIKMKGETTVELLNKKLNLPPLLQGVLSMEGTLQLTDDPHDLDHLQVKTSLVGLSVDLPRPFGKTTETEAPLIADVDFNPERAVRLRLNYDNRLSSDLWFSRPKDNFELQKGEIRLGSGQAIAKNQTGLRLVGGLPYFDLDQWLKVKAKLPALASKSTTLEVNLRMKKAKIWKENYDDLTFKAARLNGEDWSIQLDQARVAANLHYKPSSNTLIGQFDKLHLENKSSGSKLMTKSTLKPTDLPNLKLHIASFQLGDLDLGDVSLKTRTTANYWQLENCKIKSPSYLLTAEGEWKHEGKENSTALKANLHINDLAESLRRLKISPVVGSREGDVRFQGGWPGTIADFSWASVNGELAMQFKDGRITDFSRETEEKLGLGKLLSILSLQTIPRRLKLDFSDLANGGYSFDQFQGNFTINNGVMMTKDSFIDGPVAYASMNGNLDIAKQLYDVNLKISPHITASLPVVATIAGGPVAGFATWIASKIINQGMQKIGGYSYKISGPWKQPVVEEVSIIKKHFAARGAES